MVLESYGKPLSVFCTHPEPSFQLHATLVLLRCCIAVRCNAVGCVVEGYVALYISQHVAGNWHLC